MGVLDLDGNIWVAVTCRGTTLVNIPLISKRGLGTWATWHKA